MQYMCCVDIGITLEEMKCGIPCSWVGKVLKMSWPFLKHLNFILVGLIS